MEQKKKDVFVFAVYLEFDIGRLFALNNLYEVTAINFISFAEVKFTLFLLKSKARVIPKAVHHHHVYSFIEVEM